MSVLRSIKDAGGFSWQNKPIMKFIRNLYPKGQRQTTALAIYCALTELASNHGSEIFNAYYLQISELCGKSIPTVKNYCRDFIKHRILIKKYRKKDERINLANEWQLLTHPVNNKYPTSDKYRYTSSDNNSYLHLEENKLKETNKKIRDGEAYQHLREMVSRIRTIK